MSEQEIYDRLNEVFRNVFDDDEITVDAGRPQTILRTGTALSTSTLSRL